MKTKRSTLFTICVFFTIIGNGFAVFFNGVTLLFIDAIQQMMSENNFKESLDSFFGEDFFSPEQWDDMGNILAATPIISTIKFVAAIGSIVGVWMLFRGKSQGFLWYVTAQLLEIVLPTLLVDALHFSVFSIAITLGFFLVYNNERRRLEINS